MRLRKFDMRVDQTLKPYRSTPIFDEISLPDALRREHRTKLGVWGVVRVHAGQLKLSFVDPARERVLGPGDSGLLLPDQPHFVTPVGSVRMQVDFYDKPPLG